MRVKDVNWVDATFLVGYHLLFLISLPLYLIFFSQQAGLWIALPILVVLSGIGVTSLYHRCYSHRTYHLNKVPEIIILFFGTLATQGSALQWSYDHRLHHRYVDSDKDPYSINKGFWHAHFIWMLKKRPKYDPKVVHDLVKNPLVVFQDKYYEYLVLITNLSVVVFFGWLFNDIFGAFVILYLTRLFINHHTTWFINSLAHTWGVQPFSKEHTAVNNWVISLLTYGEGYHNYHHTFAGDYRNGIYWYQFDPTKFLILGLNKVGLARNLRKVDQTIITQKLLMEDKRLVLDKIKHVGYVKLAMLEKEANKRVEALSKKLAAFRALARDYKEQKRLRTKREKRKLRIKIKRLKKSIRIELRSWSKYCDSVLSLKPTLA